jgi:hypothetical protein
LGGEIPAELALPTPVSTGRLLVGPQVTRHYEQLVLPWHDDPGHAETRVLAAPTQAQLPAPMAATTSVLTEEDLMAAHRQGLLFPLPPDEEPVLLQLIKKPKRSRRSPRRRKFLDSNFLKGLFD